MGVNTGIQTSRPTTLYLARHGETEYNRLQIMQGRRINAALNVSGRAQAQALGERFVDVPLDAIYASTLWRAIQTAGSVAERHPRARTVRCFSAFDEMSWGRFEGMAPCDELSEMLETTFARWDSGDFETCVDGGGESIMQVQARALRGLHRLLRIHDGESILVVAHGRLIRVLLASILPEFGLSRMQQIAHGNTSVNEIVITREGCHARSMNCIRHLEALAA